MVSRTNIIYAVRGTPRHNYRSGHQGGIRKLTFDQACVIRTILEVSDMPQVVLARRFGISGCALTFLHKGMSYHTKEHKDSCAHTGESDIMECVRANLNKYREANPNVAQQAAAIISEWQSAEVAKETARLSFVGVPPNMSRRLTFSEVCVIRTVAEFSDMRQIALGRIFRVNHGAISKIINGKSYHTEEWGETCPHHSQWESMECIRKRLIDHREAHPEIVEQAFALIRQVPGTKVVKEAMSHIPGIKIVTDNSVVISNTTGGRRIN